MAENEQENQEQGQEEGAVGEEQGEGAEAIATLTQAQFDAALSERIKEIKDQSAAELRAQREQAEAAIRGYQKAYSDLQGGSKAPVDEDDPKPVGLTRDQEIMWAANAPSRVAMNRKLKEMQVALSRTVNPLLQDNAVQSFFRSKPGLPDGIKSQITEMFSEASNNPNVTASPEQIIQAAYIRALAADNEARLFGGQHSGVQGQGQQQQARSQVKPQPTVISPNGSADVGGGTRPIGMGRVGKKDMTWREIQADLIARNKFPGDPDS